MNLIFLLIVIFAKTKDCLIHGLLGLLSSLRREEYKSVNSISS
ncbi:MAG: hypothetical protein BAJALOKI2v1_780020 [Promethearchaeota archaeon]|nr:MAG: hypothetical protein BAJALOKI2v1_780020 [Candidatus Lokiarchaeota archaeon]